MCRLPGHVSRRLQTAYAYALCANGADAIQQGIRWRRGRLRASHVTDDPSSGHPLRQRDRAPWHGRGRPLSRQWHRARSQRSQGIIELLASMLTFHIEFPLFI